jgi:cobalamin biosynthetic protein CobC
MAGALPGRGALWRRPGDWLDLSTGINPGPGRAPVDWRGLPDAGVAGLERRRPRISAAHHCCAVPGSEMALRLIWAAGAPPICGPPIARMDRPLPMRCRAGLPRTRHAAAGHPNNPDGRIMRPPLRLAYAGRARRMAGGGRSLCRCHARCFGGGPASASGQWRRLVVLRSFGKFFGLAGLRLGFVLGPDESWRLRALLGDWPLGAAALAHGTAAYRDRRGRRSPARSGRRAARMDAAGAPWLRAGACPAFPPDCDAGAGLLRSWRATAS